MSRHRSDRDDPVDALFDTARKGRDVPTDEFLARLEADAEAALRPAAVRDAPKTHWKDWLSHRWVPALGLTGVTATGVVIGLTLPIIDEALPFSSDEGFVLSEFLPGYDAGAFVPDGADG